MMSQFNAIQKYASDAFSRRMFCSSKYSKKSLEPFSDKTMVKRQLVFSLILFDQLPSQREKSYTEMVVQKLGLYPSKYRNRKRQVSTLP